MSNSNRVMMALSLVSAIMIGIPYSHGEIVKDVSVKGGSQWTSYDIPPSGANLKLNVNKGDAQQIVSSHIRVEDTSDFAMWTNISKTVDLHVYRILSVTPGHEWVAIEGEYVAKGGGSGSASANVPFEVGVVNVDVKSVTFTSDDQVLMNYNADFAGSIGPGYTPRGWVKNIANNPVSHTQGKKVTVEVVLCANPPQLSMEIQGVATPGLNFPNKRFTSTGADQTITMTAADPLPNTDRVRNESISWLIKPPDGLSFLAGTSGPHRLYVTVGAPGSGPTYKRMDFVCTKARTCQGESDCADALWNAVSAETYFYTGNGQWDDWHLLDSWNMYQGGDCDNQARCMSSAVKMLGIRPSVVACVYGSTNAGIGNCLAQDIRTCPAHPVQPEVLILDFLTTGLNEYEGCCSAAGNFYAITPKKKAANDYQMLKKLGAEDGVTQVWCFRNMFGSPVPCGQPGSTPPIP